MNIDFESALKKLNHESVLKALPGIRRGFEKECLRIAQGSKAQDSHIAMSPHPEALGSNLTHPMITTDYSEALLEFITPPLSSIEDLFSNLKDLHHYTYASLQKEALWAFSMPCHLPEEKDIPIARYGHSNLGLLKYYYRVGLGHRYGKRMQMIAGVHYNFSFSIPFWRAWQEVSYDKEDKTDQKKKTLSEKDFISEQYLGMIRNALRYSWLFPFLFGASPAIASGFIHKNVLAHDNDLQYLDQDTIILPYATSLRLSDFGYHNKTKPIVEVSYNSFPEFVESLHRAVHTSDPEFAKMGVKVNGEYRQLSDSVLQVEDEHYALLRPKRVSGPGERMFSVLAKEGIEYIEVRALDLNPFSSIGVEPESVYILDTFLLLCLLLESKPIDTKEQEIISSNLRKVVHEGRKSGLTLKTMEGGERLLQDISRDVLNAMGTIAVSLDKAYNSQKFSESVRKAQAWLVDFNQLPSARILSELQETKESYCEFANRWSNDHAESIKKCAFDKTKWDYFANMAIQSLVEQKILEQDHSLSFDEYLAQFLQA